MSGFAALAAHAQMAPDLESWTDPVPDDLRRLSGDELREIYRGKTYYGTYRLHTPRSNTRHYTEIHTQDGEAIYKEGNFRATGRYFFSDQDELCFVYDDQPDVTHCFYKFISGTCIFGYTAVTADGEKPMRKAAWTSKAVEKGKTSSCDTVIG